jgi:hypothetical protein
LIAGGSFWVAGGVEVNAVASWNGTSWSAPGDGIWGDVSALAVDDNQLIVGGFFAYVGDVDANSVAARDGASWSPVRTAV